MEKKNVGDRFGENERKIGRNREKVGGENGENYGQLWGILRIWDCWFF